MELDEVLRGGARDKMRAEDVRAWFGESQVLRGVTLPVRERKVTAIIGPSGCGKSTFLRCLNRMHEISAGARVLGRVMLDEPSPYERACDVYAAIGCVQIGRAHV